MIFPVTIALSASCSDEPWVGPIMQAFQLLRPSLHPLSLNQASTQFFVINCYRIRFNTSKLSAHALEPTPAYAGSWVMSIQTGDARDGFPCSNCPLPDSVACGELRQFTSLEGKFQTSSGVGDGCISSLAPIHQSFIESFPPRARRSQIPSDNCEDSIHSFICSCLHLKVHG